MPNESYFTVRTLRALLAEQPPEHDDYVIVVDVDWKLESMTELDRDDTKQTWGAGRHTRTFPGAFIVRW